MRFTRRAARTSFVGQSPSAAERRNADLFLADLLGIPAAKQQPAAFPVPAGTPPRQIRPVEAWAENALPEPVFPARQPGALSGSAFMKSIWDETHPGEAAWTKREKAILAQLQAGNMPGWLRRWVTIEVKNASNQVAVRVLPDYLCVGDDTDFRHVPLDQHSAQRIADAFGACLPTSKICHAIYCATPRPQRIGKIDRDYYLPPSLRKVSKNKWAQTSTAAYDEHSVAIQAAMRARNITPGQIVAGHKKDVVIANLLHSQPNMIAFHGFYDREGYPVQPCIKAGIMDKGCNREAFTIAHPEAARFADYSQGVRLVHPVMEIDGKAKLVKEVLTDHALSKLISMEGPIRPPRIPKAAKAFAGESAEDDDQHRPCGCGGRK